MQKQPVTLDQAVVLGQVEELRKTVEDVKLTLEEMKKGLCELAERVARVEMNADVSQTGLDEVYRTLELHGLMKNGEPVKDSKTEPKGEWDPQKIKWATAQGTRGQYERAEDVNNLEFKAMLKDLAAHKGKLLRGGFFYWIFQDDCTIGRKRRGKEC